MTGWGTSRPVYFGGNSLNIHKSTVDYLITFPVFDTWQEMMDILQQLASKRPRVETLRNPGHIAQHFSYNCGTVESGVMIPISRALAIAPARVCTPNFR